MKDKFFLIVLAILLSAVYWRWFLEGPKVANDFPLVSDSLLRSFFDLPRTWTEKGAEGLGEYSAFFLWAWPLSFIFGILSKLSIPFSILERFFFLIPILILGTIGIFKICERLNFSKAVKIICSFFYLTNTYILLLIDGGQLSIGLAYSLFPLSFLALEKATESGFKEKIIAGLVVTLLGFFDIRFVYILLVLCLLRFSYEFLFLDKKAATNWILNWLRTGIVIVGLVAFLNAFWLIPLIKAPISQNTYDFFTELSISKNINLGHSLLLISPHWYKNVFGKISDLRFEFLLIPFLIFLSPILRPKNKILGFWLVVTVFSTFLAKGASEPFPKIYSWLFDNIPYFSLFRDSTKFLVLVALSYTILLGITLDEILKRLKNLKIKCLLMAGIVSYLVLLVKPVWFGEMTGTFSENPYQNEYQKLRKILKNDNNFSRVFWIPSFPPLGYSSEVHPRVEASRLVQKRTFAIGTVGEYEIFNFLREAPFMGEIFDISGIRYIVYPPLDPRRDSLKPDDIRYYYLFSNQLSNLLWLDKVEESPIPLWKTKSHQDRFFTTKNIWWVIGSDNIYKESTKSSSLKLSKNALIFSEEYPGLGDKLEKIPNAKIILNNKTLIDLATSFINGTELIFPAKNLSHEPDPTSGWWQREGKDLISWRYFLNTKYKINNQDFDLGGGWAIGEGNLELTVSDNKIKKDKILLARVLESTKSGNLKFYQNEEFIGQINTGKEGNNVRWFEIGRLKKDGDLKILSEGDINVINSLASLDEDQWKEFQNKAKSLKDRIFDFSEKNVIDSEAHVTYQQINPTKYKVVINNLKESELLIFSQNYDNNWKLGVQSSLPAYSLLNGFQIEKNGEFIVEFEPQKNIPLGLIVSGLTLMSAGLLLLVLGKRP